MLGISRAALLFPLMKYKGRPHPILHLKIRLEASDVVVAFPQVDLRVPIRRNSAQDGKFETMKMAAETREGRMKRIIAGLRNDSESLKHVQDSTRAYQNNQSTTLDQMRDYVKANRPSSRGVGLRAKVTKLEAAEVRVPEMMTV